MGTRKLINSLLINLQLILRIKMDLLRALQDDTELIDFLIEKTQKSMKKIPKKAILLFI